MRQIGSFENVTKLFFVAKTTQKSDAIPPMMLEGNVKFIRNLSGNLSWRIKVSNLNVTFVGMAFQMLEMIKLYVVRACAIRCKTRAYYPQ